MKIATTMLAATPVAAGAIQAEAKCCIRGTAIGGVAEHYLADRGIPDRRETKAEAFEFLPGPERWLAEPQVRSCFKGNLCERSSPPSLQP